MLVGMRQFPSVPLAVPAELDTTVQSSSRPVIRRPASQRWSPRTDAVTRRREPLSDVGSDRCLHPGDNRTVLPSLPLAALSRILELF